jgi:hypothetical protein
MQTITWTSRQDVGKRRQVLQSRIGYLLKRPVGRPPNQVRRFHANFSYQAGSWTKPRRVFAANAVRLQLHALAYNLGNFLRTLATPEPIKDWSLTSLKEKLIKIGAKVVSHGRYVIFQMAEVAIPRQMFQDILRLIAELRPQPPPAPA